MNRVLALPGVRETVSIDHVTCGYHSIKALNLTGIIPPGSDLPWLTARAGGCACRSDEMLPLANLDPDLGKALAHLRYGLVAEGDAVLAAHQPLGQHRLQPGADLGSPLAQWIAVPPLVIWLSRRHSLGADLIRNARG
jgi:hypothetical protein